MRFTVFLFLAMALAPEGSRAELPSLFGFGPRSQAMGGTALDQGLYSPFQVYSAPAALGYLRRVEIYLGAQYLEPNLKPFGTLVVNSNGTRGQFDESGVLAGGGSILAFAIPFGRSRPLVFAGTIYMPFTSLIRVSSSPVDYPFYPLYSDLTRNFFFVVGAGYEFVDGWSFGVNVRSTTKSTVSYVLRADSTVNYSASATEAKSQSRLSYSVVYDHGRRNPRNPWSIGAMYRAHASMETKISAGVSAFVPVQGELTSYPSYTPAEWVLMGAMRPHANFAFSLEASRVEWRKYQSPYGVGNINSLAINSTPASFHDITVVRFGMEQPVQTGTRTIRRVTYRQGYQLHPSPVPDQTGDSNFVDSTRHMLSLGLGLGVASPWRDDDLIDLDFFFQYNLLKNRQISKAATNNIGAPGYVAGGNILLFGGGASIRF